jgi:cytochrome b subunit of formate dehydrogenase
VSKKVKKTGQGQEKPRITDWIIAITNLVIALTGLAAFLYSVLKA